MEPLVFQHFESSHAPANVYRMNEVTKMRTPVPPVLPIGACVGGAPPIEVAAGSGVYRWVMTWEAQPAILLSAGPEASAHDRLRALIETVSGNGASFRRDLVLAAQSEAAVSWIVLNRAAETLSQQSTSVAVDAQASHGIYTECLAALTSALDALETLDAERSHAPAGIDWLARDEQGRWRLNALDPGVWTVENSRNWRQAAYDLVWAVALGRRPSMHDAPAYLVIPDCPAWFSTALANLAGHRGDAPKTIAEARSLLRDTKKGARIRKAAMLSCIAAAVSAGTLAWIDARTVATARGIAERTEGTAFERRDALKALVAEHPMLLFGRGTVGELVEQSISRCNETTAAWRSDAIAALNAPPMNTSEFGSRLQGLIDRAAPFKNDVAETEIALRRRLSEVRAESVLAAKDATAVALVTAAAELRAQGSTSSELLNRLRAAFDDMRWKQVRMKPSEQALAREVDQYLESLAAYLADVPEDVTFGGKYRRYAAEAEAARLVIVEQRERAKIRELDELIASGRKAGNLVIAADRIMRLRGDRDQTRAMREKLLEKARYVQGLQREKLAAMKQQGGPLADRAKAILDWEKLVGRDPEAFPQTDIREMAEAMAREFAIAIANAQSPGELPAASPSLQAVLGLAGGTLQDGLLRAHALSDTWLRKTEKNFADFNRLRHSEWILQQHFPDLYRDGVRLVRLKTSGVSLSLLARVDDHIGNDWIAKVVTDGGFSVDMSDREVASDLSRPIDFAFVIYPGDDLFFLEGARASITVWDDDWGSSDPILLQGDLIFSSSGIRLKPHSGDANAVRITLMP